MALTSKVSVSLTASQTSALDLGTATFEPALSVALSLASGTAANQADMIWTDTRTLAASANEDLDLAGVLTNHLTGAAMTFAKVKAIVVSASSANTNSVLVTRPGSNGVPAFIAAGDGVSIGPGGFFALAAPGTAGVATVTASTGDLINVANSAGSTEVIYSIAVIGTSA